MGVGGYVGGIKENIQERPKKYSTFNQDTSWGFLNFMEVVLGPHEI